jgi:hemolysin III
VAVADPGPSPQDALGASAAEPARGRFFDARRGVYFDKPRLRGWMHLIWFVMSLVAGVLLLARARGDVRFGAGVVYATSVSALFGASALYHRGTWTLTWRRRLQRLDHMMIFFLIAGTATPAFLIAMHGTFGVSCLIVLWVFAVTACAVHMAWMNAPELLVGGMFVGLGWMGGLAIPGVWMHGGAWPGFLVLAGGLLYTTGALCYRRRRPNPVPSVFGYHEVFHTFVCAAAACQYVAMARLIG